MSTLRGRIFAALLVFGLTTLLAVGGALWVSLRDLHRDATLASLAELTLPYSAQARQRLPLSLLRPLDDEAGSEVLPRFRDSPLGLRASSEFSEFVEQTQEEIEAAGISVLLVQDESTFLQDPATGEIDALPGAPDVLTSDFPGGVETGRTTIDGLGEVLYAATPIRVGRSERAIPVLMLAREDDSAQLATADLSRAMGIAALVLVLVGFPLAVGLSRSVSRPLRRLAAASVWVARGEMPEPLPSEGPREVAEASVAFNAMAAEVSASREAQRQLLADIRHDLRTPLTVIAGFAQALRDGTATGRTADRAANAIWDEAGRLERMLNDLDQLTGPGNEGPWLRPDVLDGVALAREAVARFMTEAEARGQALVLADGVAPAPLVADPDAVARILGNIVANALAHAPSPGGRAELEVRVIQPGDAPVGGAGGWAGRRGVVLAVRDDGPGIPPHALMHVFDRFYRADPARSSPGSGLGLAIVRDLADALGGRAFAENPPDGGARVGVVLPAAPPSAAPVPMVAAAGS